MKQPKQTRYRNPDDWKAEAIARATRLDRLARFEKAITRHDKPLFCFTAVLVVLEALFQFLK